MDAEVIVVGGGPGGASAAYALVRQGYSVLVLEKASLPRYKTCAGCVPAGGMELLPFSFEPVIEQEIDQATFTCGPEAVTQPVPGNSLFMVMRDRFDWFLLQRSGAEIETGAEVLVVEESPRTVTVRCRDGRAFKAAHVIGADGPNSRVAASLGLRRRRVMGVAVEFELEASAAVLERFQGRLVAGFQVIESGYYWIFPKTKHLSIGIGTMEKGGLDLTQTLSRAIAPFELSLEGAKRSAHPLPVYRGPELVHGRRCLLVGDAAGLMDPLTGEGIRHAMMSGKLAAEAIHHGSLEHYSRTVYKRIGRDLCRARRLARFFYGRQRLCFHWLVRHRRIFQQMTRILACRSSYGRALAAMPLLGLDFWDRRPLDA